MSHSSKKGPEKFHKKSSKVTQNVLKRASMSSRCSESLQNVPKVLSSLNSPQRSSHQCPQRVHEVLISSKRSWKVLKTSSKYSQIPQVLSRSSDPRNVLNVPKVLESPQKQLKVITGSQVQRFQERSWKDPQKVLKSYSKCPQKGLKVLKMFWKVFKCPQSTQFLK